MAQRHQVKAGEGQQQWGVFGGGLGKHDGGGGHLEEATSPCSAQ